MTNPMGTSPTQISNRLAKIEKLLGISPIGWKELGSNVEVPEADLPENFLGKTFQLPTDVYSIVATGDWKAAPFWIAMLIIFGLQFFLLALLLFDQVGIEEGNILGIPANVQGGVRAAQVLAMVIAFFKQNDLRRGIEGLSRGLPSRYQGDEEFCGIRSLQWNFAYIVRSLQGLLCLFASFVLLIQAESVFDVLLNFLGIEFISELDDIAFTLGGQGYLGPAVKQVVENILQAKFLMVSSTGTTITCHSTRKVAHFVGFFALLACMLVSFITLALKQAAGEYSIMTVTAEFGDEVISSMGFFNGCYTARKEGPSMNGRLVYEQFESGANGGRFGYCDDLADGDEGWVFFDGKATVPCQQYIIRSDTTKTFDLLEIGSSQWYTKDDQLFDYLQLTRAVSSWERCGLDTFLEKNDCDLLDLSSTRFNVLQEGSSQIFAKIPVDKIQVGTFLGSAALSHPIFVGNSSSELILFTGRRWVLADAEQMNGQPSRYRDDDLGWNHSLLVDYFYNQGFRAIEQTNPAWVIAISESIDAIADAGTPLAVQWYGLRKGSSESMMYGFPFADLTQPQQATLRCGRCNDDTRPCDHGGTCSRGVCECSNKASGIFCEDAPLGDGICDPYYNFVNFDYDGGDCCAHTCNGPFCGNGGLNIAFGVDLKDNDFWGEHLPNDATPIGFEHCKDPAMVEYTIQLVPIEEIYDGNLHGEDCGLEEVKVKCDDVLYLRTPNIYMGESVDEVEKCHLDSSLLQPIKVPSGVRCELSRPLDDYERFYEILLFRGNRTDSSMRIREGNNGTSSLSWTVPSECLQEVFTEYLGNRSHLFDTNTFEGKIIEQLSADGTSAFLCGLDHDLVLERYALAAFRNSVSIDSKNFQAHQCFGWGSGRDGIDIVCNDMNKIISIEYESGGGTIPSEIGLLTDLTLIDLRDSTKQGTLPTEIGLLNNLQRLYMNSNQLTGSIPSEIGKMSRLEFLYLYDNQLTGSIPSEIGNMNSLEKLYLYGNQLTGSIPSEIGNMNSLVKLDLDDNQLTGSIPSEIGNMNSLVELDLDGNQITYPSNAPTTQDYKAYWHPARVESILAPYKPLDEATMKWLTETSTWVPAEGDANSEYLWLERYTLALFYASTNGQSWSNNDKWLTSEPVCNWFGLEAGIPNPNNPGPILRMNFDRNQLTGSIPSEIGNLNSLVKLDLGNNQLVGSIPSEIGNMNSLLDLYLDGNQLTGSIPSEIGNMSRLLDLSLYSNQLTGSIPSEIGNLNNLIDLRLWNNQLTGSIPSEIGNMSRLLDLSLYSNQLTGSIPSEIGNMNSLVDLSLDDNQLTGTAPSSICNMSGLDPWSKVEIGC